MTKTVWGVLLLAAPLFAQSANLSDYGFRLSETRSEISKQLGLPVLAAPFGDDFESWQYQIGPTEEEGYSHQFVFRKSTGTLISMARNYQPERNVDDLFPSAETTTHFYPNAEKPTFSVRVRRLSGARLLIAMGVSKPGQNTGQVFLIRETEVRFFLPWLAPQLTISK
jgi:hypothetical protein